jgi:hypothetical protein
MPARCYFVTTGAITADPPGGTGNAIALESQSGGGAGITAETNTLASVVIDPDDAITGDPQTVELQLVFAGITFTAATTDVITSAGHGLTEGQPVVLETTGTLPAGPAADTTYYWRYIDVNTGKLSLTVGGAFVDITATGIGTHTLRKLGTITAVLTYPTTGPAVPVKKMDNLTGEPVDFRKVRALQCVLQALDTASNASGRVQLTLGDPGGEYDHQDIALNLAHTGGDPDNWPSATLFLPAGMAYDTGYPLVIRFEPDVSNENLRFTLTLMGR